MKAAFVYDDRLSRHILSESHPMKPVRLRYTYELLSAYGSFNTVDSLLVPAREAKKEEILSFHTEQYFNGVRSLGRSDDSVDPRLFNFGPGDNPHYPGIDKASLLSSGATMKATDMLIDGQVEAAFSIAGGLHHAMPNYTYGFCVFNDPVLAINKFLKKGLKVAYVDIDCHHGDGVQHAYYDTDQVLTISVHESGSFLFPGTGFPEEIGAGKGRGYSVNVPLYPYTSDEDYLWAFKEIVPPLIQQFKPDVLVTQHGIDSHFKDPITHLGLTVQGHAEIVHNLKTLSPDMWLSLGGGGYDVQAVARAWTMDYGVITGQELSDDIPEPYASEHGINTLSDHHFPEMPTGALKEIRHYTESSVRSIHNLIFRSHGIIPA